MVNITTITTTEDAHQHIQWVRGSRHLCMRLCMYLCKVVVGKRYACKCVPLFASHGNVIACMYECHTEWYVQCMVNGWMIVDCDEWQW